MDFFTSTDWLGREGPYAFKLDHLLFILISLSLGVLLAFLLKKKDKKIIKGVLIGLWAFTVAVEVFYYSVIYTLAIKDPTGHPFNIEYNLPLHSCLMYSYIFPLAMFVKNKTIKTMANNLLVVVNMIMGFITLFVGCPPKGYSALSFHGLQSMMYHSIIVVSPIIMLVTNFYDIKAKDIKYGLILFGFLTIMMWTFDAITGCDYFYIYDGHTFGILYEISENVHHLVWTLIVVSCYVITAFVVHYMVIGIKYLVSKKQNKLNSNE